ncbi:LptF/LptG family permease [Helicobacter burdigaliensis]|uniref:LptF/LptG family permease n=1 Tax=Helicobacter burdigaliensis TaxID=2315334 RepID=UPI000EF7407A|nr:LptF/LptG family permease [Helicobacter burdigaliensis]
MKLFNRYLTYLYLKYFLIFFVSLECFFVVVDLAKYLDRLPNSANLMVLLIFYDFLYASNFILPLALILAQIVLFLTLVKNSQFTAFLALGYTKIRLFIPVFISAFLITCFYILLNFTPFTYAKERIDMIVDQGFLGDFKKDLFVKYDNSYVYFGRIFPFLKSAENIKVYEFNKEGTELECILESPKATFSNNEWILENVKIEQINNTLQLGKTPLNIEEQTEYKILSGFRPKILDSIYELENGMSILDAYEAIFLLKNQEINTQKMRGVLYSLVFFPFFAPLIMVILAYFVPNSNRYCNLMANALGMILIVLVVWGIFFGFSRLSMSGFLQPEISILGPILLLALSGVWMFFKLSKV